MGLGRSKLPSSIALLVFIDFPDTMARATSARATVCLSGRHRLELELELEPESSLERARLARATRAAIAIERATLAGASRDRVSGASLGLSPY
jgi:hypothetical protein